MPEDILPTDGDQFDGSTPAETAVSEQEPVAGVPEGPAKNWFIIHTYSGFENKVAESLRTRAEACESTCGPPVGRQA